MGSEMCIRDSLWNPLQQQHHLAFEFDSNCQAVGGLAVRVEFKCFVSAPFSIVPALFSIVPAPIAMRKAMRFSQRWDSGWRCRQAAHYDTNMHVFVNPGSRWKIRQTPWRGARCEQKHSSWGCNINNINGWECGKIVNMIVMQAERDAHKFRI